MRLEYINPSFWAGVELRSLVRAQIHVSIKRSWKEMGFQLFNKCPNVLGRLGQGYKEESCNQREISGGQSSTQTAWAQPTQLRITEGLSTRHLSDGRISFALWRLR